MKKTIYEIFQDIKNSDSPDTVLKYVDDTIFKFYVMNIYQTMEWSDDLDSVLPDYIKFDENIPNEFADQYLRSSFKRMYLFSKNHAVDPVVRNKQWLGLLESLHYNEAALLMSIRNGQYFDDYALYHKGILAAFSDIIVSESTGVKLLNLVNNTLDTIKAALVEAINTEPVVEAPQEPVVIEFVPEPVADSVVLPQGMIEGAKNLMDTINEVVEVKQLGDISEGVTVNAVEAVETPETPKKRGRKPKVQDGQ